MVLEHRTGDLFAQTDLDAIGHGCNTMGKMGGGIAVLFRRYYPDMFTEYRRLCLSGDLSVGGMFAWETAKGKWIYNLASQQRTGRDARIEAIEASLDLALVHATEHGVTSIGLPRIGAGIGGLRWPDVQAAITEVAAPSPVRVVLVSQPGT